VQIALVADIHSNGYALDAVVRDAESMDVHRFWCLGDVVGYGPHPVKGLEFLRDRVQKNAWVLGNHDAAFVGLCGLDDWREHAVEALELNREAVIERPGLERWCQGTFRNRRRGPVVRDYRDGRYVLVHGSLLDALSDYVFPWQTAYKIPKELDRLRDAYLNSDGCPVCLCHAHTHIAAFYTQNGRVGDASFVNHTIGDSGPIDLGTVLNIINPGSVGQPRDGDRRAAYCILDTRKRTIEFRRVSYDHKKTMRDLVHPVRYPDLVQRILGEALVPSQAPAGWFTRFCGCDRQTGAVRSLMSLGQPSERASYGESSHVP